MLPDRMSSEREAGFTLIELLIAICISGILIGAITTGFIVSLRGTATAHDRLVASNGSHTLSTYFTADVESANPDYTSADPAATLGCASEPTGTTTNVLRLQWSEMTTSTELRAFSVSYRIVASDTDADAVNDRWQLVRYSCSASQDPFTTTMANVLSLGALTDHVVVDELHEPTGTSVTAATVNTASRDISLVAYAALVKGESAPYSYTFSATMRTPEPAPRVVSITRNGAATTNAATVAWTVKFSEAVTGVDDADFAFTYTGSATGASVVPGGVTGSGTTYTVTANTGSGQGTLALTVDDNDTILSTVPGDPDPLGGSGIDNGNYTGGGYTVDRLAPSVTVVQSTGQADPASTLPILFTATFDESVTDFDDATDVTNMGTAPGAVFSITGSGKDYVISVTGLTGSGTVIPSVIAGAAKDSAGNDSTVFVDTGENNKVQYNAVAPTVSITNVELKNSGVGGSNVGQLERDDQVVITFSDSMDVDTFCSTWTGTTPSITANGVVRVTVTDGGAGNDVLTVTTTSGCTFNLGSVNLGSAGWVTGTTNFEGNGGSASEIAYNDATRQLTITLGGGTSGPSGVAASTPIYSADTTNIRGSNGGQIANSPKTATGPSRF